MSQSGQRERKTFDEWYAVASEYYKEHGNLLVPSAYVAPDGSRLGNWICQMRNAYIYTGKLSIEQVRSLEKIGMVWQPRNQQKKKKAGTKDFEEWYDIAKEYHKEHGNLLVPRTYVSPAGDKLGRWIERMRAVYNGKEHATLTFTQIKSLEKIGMVWRLEQRFAWEEWILQCKLYHGRFGNLLVPGNYVVGPYALGSWIREQRKKRKRGCLDEQRIRELDSLGMVWEAVDRELWLRTYEHAKDYLSTHADIPKEYRTEDGILLRNWLIRQKSAYRLEACKEDWEFEKHELLSKLEGVWEPTPKKPARGYEYAAHQYYLEHGNMDVPQGYFTQDGLDLHSWVKKNWVIHHWPKDSKRKRELEALGFDWSLEGKWDWDPKEKRWLKNFKEIEDYADRNGRLPLKEHSFLLSSGIDSGNWIKYNQARKIAPEKERLLERIGVL